jgi:1-acyl-sn-glycerol-3-phosphate acyltransferase
MGTSTFSSLARAAFSLWLRARGIEVKGTEAVRGGYRALLSRSGALVFSNHLSLADGVLLWWVLSPVRRPYIAADFSLFPRAFSLLLSLPLCRCVGVRPSEGLRANRAARESIRNLVARGEAVLVFPEGTRGESFSYLAGAALQDGDGGTVGLISISASARPKDFAVFSRSTRLELKWRETALPAGTGLSGLKDAALGVNRALGELSSC